MAVMSLAATDIDEMHEIGRSVFLDAMSLAQARLDEQLRFDLKAASLGPLTAALFTYGGCEMEGFLGGAGMDQYIVAVSLSGAWRVRRTGDEELMLGGPVAVIVSAERPVSVHRWEQPNEETVAFTLPAAALHTELERMTGTAPGGPIDFRLGRLELHTGPGAEWWHIIRTVLSALRGESDLVLHPMLRAQIAEIFMAGLLLAVDHPYRDQIEARATTAHPPLIVRAMRLLEERAAQPVTISEIAAEVGCSVRSLFSGFQRHVGTTPYRYLMRVRLDAAHAELVAGTPDSTTVAQIASSWGFINSGRFAASYRSLYGVSPSETLAR